MDIRIPLVAIAATLAGYYIWRNAARNSSLIRGTATAKKIGSAAKGYTELRGIAAPATLDTLRDPIAGTSCVWFRVITETRKFRDHLQWRIERVEVSARPFVIEDDTARCLLSPVEAGIDAGAPSQEVKERWNRRHKIWRIRTGDPIYAIGHLQRASEVGMQVTFSRASELEMENGRLVVPPGELLVAERAMSLLRLWKRDSRRLVARFDKDGDGRIDSMEWDAARAEAHDEAARELKFVEPGSREAEGGEEVSRGITHQLRAPATVDLSCFRSTVRPRCCPPSANFPSSVS